MILKLQLHDRTGMSRRPIMTEKNERVHPGDRLEAQKWSIDFISEMFSSVDSERFYLSETGRAGLCNILNDVRDKIEDVIITISKRSY